MKTTNYLPNNLKLNLFSSMVFLMLCNCKKNNNTTVTPNNTPTYTNNVQVLYFTGLSMKLWKNGTSQTIFTATEDPNNLGDMAIVNNDVHIVAENGREKIGYWKNGIKTAIGTTNSVGLGIAVVANDVYICGKDQGRPASWKNGVRSFLPTTFNGSFGLAYDVAVVNNDVYVVGHEVDNFGNPNAKLWKNGLATNLNTTNTAQSSYARAIQIIGNDVYIAGEINENAVLWKNGQLISQENTPNAVNRVKDLLIVNQDIYLARTAFSNNKGSYDHWKNTAQTDAPNIKSIDSFAIFGNNLYFAGANADNKTTFTQNGKETIVDPMAGRVLKIVVN